VSYDLYLSPDAFDANAIRDWFRQRANYQIDGGDITYENSETGVRFTFCVDEGVGGALVAFNINYFRPHTFALEAEPEVAACLARFPGRIDDPQHMGDGPYSRDGFLAGWNHGNRTAFEIAASRGLQEPLAADPARIEAAWAWNYARAQLQAEAGENLFAPKIVWLQPAAGAAPEAAVTWTFGVATIIPESLITRVVLVRQERPKLLKMFARNPDPKFEYRLLGIESGIRIAGIEHGQIDGRPALFTPGAGPLEMQALFSGNWPSPQFQLVPPEAVFGVDLISGAGPPQ